MRVHAKSHNDYHMTHAERKRSAAGTGLCEGRRQRKGTFFMNECVMSLSIMRLNTYP